jgi:hypothetical protein
LLHHYPLRSSLAAAQLAISECADLDVLSLRLLHELAVAILAAVRRGYVSALIVRSSNEIAQIVLH